MSRLHPVDLPPRCNVKYLSTTIFCDLAMDHLGSHSNYNHRCVWKDHHRDTRRQTINDKLTERKAKRERGLNHWDPYLVDVEW